MNSVPLCFSYKIAAMVTGTDRGTVLLTGTHWHSTSTEQHTQNHIYKGCMEKNPHGMFLVLTWVSGYLVIKVRTFSNSPGYAEFKNVLIFNPSFNIHPDKVETEYSKIWRLTINTTNYIWVILQKHFLLEAELIFSESIQIKLSFLTLFHNF